MVQPTLLLTFSCSALLVALYPALLIGFKHALLLGFSLVVYCRGDDPRVGPRRRTTLQKHRGQQRPSIRLALGRVAQPGQVPQPGRTPQPGRPAGSLSGCSSRPATRSQPRHHIRRDTDKTAIPRPLLLIKHTLFTRHTRHHVQCYLSLGTIV